MVIRVATKEWSSGHVRRQVSAMLMCKPYHFPGGYAIIMNPAPAHLLVWNTVLGHSMIFYHKDDYNINAPK